MRRSPLQIVVTDEERRELEHLARSPSVRMGTARRARLVLLFLAGVPLLLIAAQVGLQRRLVRMWLQRFRDQRLAGLADKRGRGRRPVFPPGGGTSVGETGLRAAG
jgi:Helix-turn-helix domain